MPRLAQDLTLSLAAALITSHSHKYARTRHSTPHRPGTDSILPRAVPYRLENAKLGTAGCKGPKPCKGTKIGKGTLRLGVVVEIMGHSGFAWRHWGCSTAKVIENLKKEVPDAEDLDGFEDLSEADQARIKAAYETGAVDPEDVPESARKPEGEDGAEDDDEKPKKRAAPKKKAAAKKAPKGEDDDEDDEKPKKKVAAKKAAPRKRKAAADESDDAGGSPPPPRAPSSRSRGPAKSMKESDDDASEDEKPKSSPKKRVRKSSATVDSEDDA